MPLAIVDSIPRANLLFGVRPSFVFVFWCLAGDGEASSELMHRYKRRKDHDPVFTLPVRVPLRASTVPLLESGKDRRPSGEWTEKCNPSLWRFLSGNYEGLRVKLTAVLWINGVTTTMIALGIYALLH